ncbi:MAG: hypothetical protein Fur0022_45700 [Anaerolineales bacterium]
MSPLPFVYIASLPRTGSTVLSEALTQLPYSFMLHEPHLGKNYFAVQPNDASRLKACGVDLYAFVKYRLPLAFLLRRFRPLGLPQDFILREFKTKLLPQLLQCAPQIGVKEIKHMGWKNYVKHFPDLKVILTGRDPRDLYISMYRKWQRGTMSWRGPFTPEAAAAFLNKEFDLQRALSQSADSLAIRYEDLCRDSAVIERVKQFIHSPIPEMGAIGAYISTHPTRMLEHSLHHGQITDQSIGRWKTETDPQLQADTLACFRHMPKYCAFWGYE